MSTWTYRFVLRPEARPELMQRTWCEIHAGDTREELNRSVCESLRTRGLRPEDVGVSPIVNVDVRRDGKAWAWDVYDAGSGEHRAGGYGATVAHAKNDASVWMFDHIVVGVCFRATWDLGAATAEARQVAERYPRTPIAVVEMRRIGMVHPDNGWRFASKGMKRGDHIVAGAQLLTVKEIITA